MSKPKLNEQRMQSELSGSAFFRRTPPPAGTQTQSSLPQHVQPKPAVKQPVVQKISRPASQSTSQSTDQSTSRPSAPVVERPKAFYITKQLDRRLDEAVRYYQEKHGVRKVDRSTVVNAMMDHDANWTGDALDRLVDRVLSQLTSR